jgi:hypothetical protein
MLKFILSFLIFFNCIPQALPLSWPKSSEHLYTIENEKISTRNAEKMIEKYQDPKTDVLSLIFDHPNPSCLQIMKELRLQDKKTKDPFSKWKLLQVRTENEIYFETFYERPAKKYVLHRLIKRNNQFYHTTLNYPGKHPNPHLVKEFLNTLENIS